MAPGQSHPEEEEALQVASQGDEESVESGDALKVLIFEHMFLLAGKFFFIMERVYQ